MDGLEFELTLIPAQGDPPLRSPSIKPSCVTLSRAFSRTGWRSLTSWNSRRRGHQSPLSRRISGISSSKLAAVVGPVLGTGIGAWLRGRYGRKVRVKVGANEIEVEAQTVEEVERLIARAQEIQQHTLPKAIHEP